MRTSDHGISLIKSHEKLRLEAYSDPGTGGEPWTIGYGHTGGVRPGDVITEEQAEMMLQSDLDDFERAVESLLPIELSQSEFDALVSFTLNVGAYSLETSTLRKRLLADEPRCWVYQKELPRWNKGRSGVLQGLVKRRQAEADLACLGYLSGPFEATAEPALGYLSGPSEVIAEPVEEDVVAFPLDVPYFYQRDSKTGHGERMCFSSAMAMALDYVDPDAIAGDDDWYINHVFKYGDTVSSAAQMAAAESLGFDVEFHTDGTEQHLLDQLDKGIPAPVGVLHKGSVWHPTGGGHWITLIGYDEKYFHVHDPFGELDVIYGGYTKAGPADGRFQKYTRENLMKRWLINGSGADGWWTEIKSGNKW